MLKRSPYARRGNEPIVRHPVAAHVLFRLSTHLWKPRQRSPERVQAITNQIWEFLEGRFPDEADRKYEEQISADSQELEDLVADFIRWRTIRNIAYPPLLTQSEAFEELNEAASVFSEVHMADLAGIDPAIPASILEALAKRFIPSSALDGPELRDSISAPRSEPPIDRCRPRRLTDVMKYRARLYGHLKRSGILKENGRGKGLPRLDDGSLMSATSVLDPAQFPLPVDWDTKGWSEATWDEARDEERVRLKALFDSSSRRHLKDRKHFPELVALESADKSSKRKSPSATSSTSTATD